MRRSGSYSGNYAGLRGSFCGRPGHKQNHSAVRIVRIKRDRIRIIFKLKQSEGFFRYSILFVVREFLQRPLLFGLVCFYVIFSDFDSTFGLEEAVEIVSEVFNLRLQNYFEQLLLLRYVSQFYRFVPSFYLLFGSLVDDRLRILVRFGFFRQAFEYFFGFRFAGC